mmetsp:Transcript_39138/g.76948  ORF Transcript_39138/g.76948 Transcript_39138/m.76948 type:complete len:269 (-) Transcript_39138:675-1481(-)
MHSAFRSCKFSKIFCSVSCVLARVHKHHDLIILLQGSDAFVVGNVVHALPSDHAVVSRDADVVRGEGNRAISVVEEVEAGFGVGSQEHSHVLVVGQSGGQAYNATHPLRRLHHPQGPGNQYLNDRAAVFVQQVHLVDDQQPYHRHQGTIPALAGHHIPLFRSCDDHLSVFDLLLGELHIPRQLFDCDTQRGKPAGKSFRNFLRQSFHWSDIDNFEHVLLQNTRLDVLPHLVQYRQHGNVGFSGAGGGTNQQVRVGLVGGLETLALDAV